MGGTIGHSGDLKTEGMYKEQLYAMREVRRSGEAFMRVGNASKHLRAKERKKRSLKDLLDKE